jgi:hypothetical protein
LLKLVDAIALGVINAAAENIKVDFMNLRLFIRLLCSID